VVEIAEGGGGQFQGAEANIIERLVVDAVRFVGVLNELVDGQRAIVGLDDHVRYLVQENSA